MFCFGEIDKILIDLYVVVFCILVEICNYGLFVDGFICDRIVFGIKDNGICKWLLWELKFIFNKCIDICFFSEVILV